MEDPNQDLLDIFSAIESIPNKPREMMEDFKKFHANFMDAYRGGHGGRSTRGGVYAKAKL